MYAIQILKIHFDGAFLSRDNLDFELEFFMFIGLFFGFIIKRLNLISISLRFDKPIIEFRLCLLEVIFIFLQIPTIFQQLFILLLKFFAFQLSLNKFFLGLLHYNCVVRVQFCQILNIIYYSQHQLLSLYLLLIQVFNSLLQIFDEITIVPGHFHSLLSHIYLLK